MATWNRRLRDCRPLQGQDAELSLWGADKIIDEDPPAKFYSRASSFEKAAKSRKSFINKHLVKTRANALAAERASIVRRKRALPKEVFSIEEAPPKEKSIQEEEPEDIFVAPIRPDPQLKKANHCLRLEVHNDIAAVQGLDTFKLPRFQFRV